MSRSGYIDDGDGENWQLIMWQGAVKSAMRGKRGQAFLRELIAALDAMPVKELVADSLVNADGQYCALGVVGDARGHDMSKIDPEDSDAVAKLFGLAPAMVREIVYENDERNEDWEWAEVEITGPVRPCYPEYGEHTKRIRRQDPHAGARRWKAMRKWAEGNLRQEVCAA